MITKNKQTSVSDDLIIKNRGDFGTKKRAIPCIRANAADIPNIHRLSHYKTHNAVSDSNVTYYNSLVTAGDRLYDKSVSNPCLC